MKGEEVSEKASAGFGRHRVELEAIETSGEGLCVFLSGGELPHVGGVAMAVPRPSLSGHGMSCDVHQLCAPGHKDVELAARVARRLSSATGQVVSATAGIHVDAATPEDIEALAHAADVVVGAWLVAHGFNAPGAPADEPAGVEGAPDVEGAPAGVPDAPVVRANTPADASVALANTPADASGAGKGEVL